MRTVCFVVVGVLAAAGVSACGSAPTCVWPAKESADANLWHDDRATEIVLSFYKVLLQEDAPTVQQERELFMESSGARFRIIAKSKEKEAQEQPVILNWCRRHNELFLPVNMKATAGAVISTPFCFARTLDRVKDKEFLGCYVMVLLADRTEPARLRTVIFSLGRSGKIDPDDISFDSFDGPSLLEKITEDIGWKPLFDPETHRATKE